MTQSNPLLDVNNVHISHEGFPTLNGVSLTMNRGEILCLLGPSGCGKTTLLRIIAGLEKQAKGIVNFEGKNLEKIPAYRRNFSMMFQEFALFPHKNVAENIAFGLKMRDSITKEIQKRVKEMISLVGLEGKEKRNIGDLSGGERQRVALARSLAPNPRLLMLDEPMGSLDRALRERLTLDLRQILKKVKATTIFVTHDQNEAFVLADRIIIVNQGLIEQAGTPEELYRKPVNEFVARFLGFQNFIPVQIVADGTIQSPLGSFKLPSSGEKAIGSQMLIRPEAARVLKKNEVVSDDEVFLDCTVSDSGFLGAVYQVQVDVGSIGNLMFHLPSNTALPSPGEKICLALDKQGMTLL